MGRVQKGRSAKSVRVTVELRFSPVATKLWPPVAVAHLDDADQRLKVEIAVAVAQTDTGADDRQIALGDGGGMLPTIAGRPVHLPEVAAVSKIAQAASPYLQRLSQPGLLTLPLQAGTANLP